MQIGYKTYFGTAVLLFLFSLVLTDSVDIASHETYLVVAKSHVAIVIGMGYLFLAGCLLLLSKRGCAPRTKLTTGHYAVTTLSLVTLVVYLLWQASVPAKRIYEYSVYGEFDANAEIHSWNNIFLVSLVVVLLLTQLVFVTALFFSLVRCLKQ